MPSTNSDEFRILNAKNMREILVNSFENFYVFYGRDTDWPAEPGAELPSKSKTYEETTRDAILAVKRVNVNNIAHVIPRIDWTSGIVYDNYDPTVENQFSKNFYVVTSEFNVYKCIDNNAGATSTVMPSGTSTSEFLTTDNYTWKFMYNISNSMMPFVLPEWVPVPVGAQRTAEQVAVEDAAAWQADGDPVGGHGANAVYELGGFFMMFLQSFEYDEGGAIPVTDEFRQTGLWVSPKDSAGNLVSLAIADLRDSNTDIDRRSGRVLYTENRTVIYRSADQIERVYVIVET